MVELIMPYVSEAIFSIMMIVVIVIACVICKKLNVEIDTSKLDAIKALVKDVVDSLTQTVVNGMKAENVASIGKYGLTDNQKDIVFHRAQFQIDSSLTHVQKKLIAKVYGSYDNGIKVLIESAVCNQAPQLRELTSVVSEAQTETVDQMVENM